MQANHSFWEFLDWYEYGSLYERLSCDIRRSGHVVANTEKE